MSATHSTIEQIRRHFLEVGAVGLSDHELLALVVGHGAGGRTAPQPLGLAELTLHRVGGLVGLARRDAVGLARLPGLGRARACLLKAAIELGRRAAVPAPPRERPIRSSAEVVEWFRCRLQDLEHESIHALLLDGKNRPLRSLKLAEGSWSSCPVDPRVVFSSCLRQGASSFILVHNHPSGDPHPSREDLELTERLARAGRLVNVRLIDHVIVSRGGSVSLADRGLI